MMKQYWRNIPSATFLGRRRVKRWQIDIQVEEVVGHPGSQTSVIDISPQGAQLEIDFPLEEKELIEFRLPVPEMEERPLIPGRAVWVRKISSEPDRFRIGVRFINPLRGLSRILFGGPGALEPRPPKQETGKKSWWRGLVGR